MPSSGTINIVYDPKNDFLDTGIDVTSGLTVLNISATGSININWGLYPNNNGPDGKLEVGYNDATTGLPHVAFIGRIGLNGSYFLIGSSYNQTVSSTGRLYVGINDPVRGDNSGSFSAIIQYTDADTDADVPCSASCNNNLILNGDFSSSSPAVDGGSATHWNAHNADITNLYISSSSTSGATISSDLNIWVDLNSCTKGYIEQSFSTIFGKEYNVYFKLSGNNFCTPYSPCGNRQDNINPIKECRVSAAGISQDYSFDITGKNSTSWQGMGWSDELFTFTAISNTTTLRFESLSPEGCFGPAIDCVEVCPTCNNTNIDVSIPGTILRSGSHTNICFRVGGPDCCNSGASNAWSNEVCIAIPPLPPAPPQPTAPAICDLDISGYDIHCNYDEGACGGGHVCNRAIFDIYVNDTFVFISNLNNGGSGGNVFTGSTIPSNIAAQDYRGNGLEYKIEARPNSANQNPHLGICQIVIYDLSGLMVFNACVPNSQVVYIAAGQNCPTPTPTLTPTSGTPTPTPTSATPTPTPTFGSTLTPTPTHTTTPTTTQTPTLTQSQAANYCLYAWGSNSSGQFGNGTNLSSQNPLGISTSFNIYELDLSSLHSLAISTSRNLYSWGSNTYGQIGDGTTIQRNSPTQISINSQNPAENEWLKISSSQFHSFAMNSLGQLYGWGRNNNWQLGDGTNVDKNIPTRVGSDQTWTSVNTGPWHTLAINNLGEIFAWGNNFNGNVGDGTNTNRLTPTKVGSSTNWTKVRAGSFSSFAINSLGELYAWGHNTNGTLGDGTNVSKNMPTRIGTETNWVDVSVFNFSVLAINSLGELYAWGYNQDGQVGDGTNTDRNSPVRIGSATNWSAISSGSAHSLAINNLGELYAWGNNQSGQLGDGTAINKNTLTRVGSNLNWQKIVGGGNYSMGLICFNPIATPTPTPTLSSNAILL